MLVNSKVVYIIYNSIIFCEAKIREICYYKGTILKGYVGRKKSIVINFLLNKLKSGQSRKNIIL